MRTNGTTSMITISHLADCLNQRRTGFALLRRFGRDEIGADNRSNDWSRTRYSRWADEEPEEDDQMQTDEGNHIDSDDDDDQNGGASARKQAAREANNLKAEDRRQKAEMLRRTREIAKVNQTNSGQQDGWTEIAQNAFKKQSTKAEPGKTTSPDSWSRHTEHGFGQKWH